MDNDPLKGLRWVLWFMVGLLVGLVFMKAIIL